MSKPPLEFVEAFARMAALYTYGDVPVTAIKATWDYLADERKMPIEAILQALRDAPKFHTAHMPNAPQLAEIAASIRRRMPKVHGPSLPDPQARPPPTTSARFAELAREWEEENTRLGFTDDTPDSEWTQQIGRLRMKQLMHELGKAEK